MATLEKDSNPLTRAEEPAAPSLNQELLDHLAKQSRWMAVPVFSGALLIFAIAYAALFLTGEVPMRIRGGPLAGSITAFTLLLCAPAALSAPASAFVLRASTPS